LYRAHGQNKRQGRGSQKRVILMRHRWPALIAVAVLAIALASAGLACAGPEHHAAGGAGKRTYIPAPAPTGIGRGFIVITGLEPSSGPPGTVVTVTGSDLPGSLTVCFGPWAATGVQVNVAGTQLSVVAPDGTGTVDVVVGNASATSRSLPFTFTGSAIIGGSAPPPCPALLASAEPSP
jgi:hypothetical protein